MTTEQQRIWHQAKRDAARLVDKLGMPIDQGILDTVAILRLMGIHTISSCAGHPDRVTNGPYVMFAAARAIKYEEAYRVVEDRKSHEYQELRKKARALNLRERQKLLPHLEAFYERRQVPYVQRLIIQEFGAKGSYLHCQGADLAHIADPNTRQTILATNQAEMAAFTQFLEDRFFMLMPPPSVYPKTAA